MEKIGCFLIAASLLLVAAKPLIEDDASIEFMDENETTTMDSTNVTEPGNATVKELYVVRAVVYEIGILAEVPDDGNDTDTDDDSSEEVQTQVQLTFSANNKNGSLDFGNIPLPVQTNVSGQILTGIAPYHVGEVANLTHALGALPITGTIVNITQSDGGFFKLETMNVTSPGQTVNGTNTINDVLSIPPSIHSLQSNNLVPL